MGRDANYGPAIDRQEGVKIIRAAVDLREIESAASKIEVTGARLPEAILAMSNR